jgi:hypothetical protein
LQREVESCEFCGALPWAKHEVTGEELSYATSGATPVVCEAVGEMYRRDNARITRKSMELELQIWIMHIELLSLEGGNSTKFSASFALNWPLQEDTHPARYSIRIYFNGDLSPWDVLRFPESDIAHTSLPPKRPQQNLCPYSIC